MRNPTKKVRGKLYVTFSPKGSGGATTLAINLAHEVQTLMQEPVALFDMDQIYSNAAQLLKIPMLHCLKELFMHPVAEIDDALLSQVVAKSSHGFDLMACGNNISAEQDMLSPQHLGQTLDYLLANYNYIFVDLPSYILDPAHQYLIERSDNILLLTQLDIPSVYRTRQYINLVREHGLTEKLRLIINRWDLQGAYGLSNEDLAKDFGVPLYAHLTDDWALNVKANSLGMPLSAVDAHADLVNDIKKLATNLVDLGLKELGPLEHKRFSKFTFSNLNLGIMNLLRKGMTTHANS